jgi:hypothetical protein
MLLNNTLNVGTHGFLPYLNFLEEVRVEIVPVVGGYHVLSPRVSVMAAQVPDIVVRSERAYVLLGDAMFKLGK